MKFTVEQFTSTKACMESVAGLQINPAIYRNAKLTDIITDFNKVLLSVQSPYRLLPAPGGVEYLRFEAERLDRALYILSCLIDPELSSN